MSEKVIKLVVAEGCETCSEIKEMDLKHVELLDINSDEAQELLQDSDAVYVPAAFDEKGDKCEIFMDDGLLTVRCDDKLVIESEDESVVINDDDFIEGEEVPEDGFSDDEPDEY